MRFSPWHATAVVFSLLGVATNGHLAGPALAVMEERAAPAPQTPSTALPAPLPAQQPSVARIDIPISWQLTKTRLMGPGATTITESFKETWTLEIRSGGVLFLKSPRTTVPAYASGPEGSSPVPQAIVVGEKDFARLVGVPTEPAPDGEDADPAAALARPVTINLGRTRNAEITMNWSEDEHYAVNLDVGNTALF